MVDSLPTVQAPQSQDQVPPCLGLFTPFATHVFGGVGRRRAEGCRCGLGGDGAADRPESLHRQNCIRRAARCDGQRIPTDSWSTVSASCARGSRASPRASEGSCPEPISACSRAARPRPAQHLAALHAGTFTRSAGDVCAPLGANTGAHRWEGFSAGRPRVHTRSRSETHPLPSSRGDSRSGALSAASDRGVLNSPAPARAAPTHRERHAFLETDFPSTVTSHLAPGRRFGLARTG